MKTDEVVIEKIDPCDGAKTSELMANLEFFRSGYLDILKDLSPDRIELYGVNYHDRYIGRVALWMADWSEPGITITPDVSELFPNLPQVHSLEIDKNYYRQGIGSMLLRVCEDSAREHGYPYIGLGVQTSNETAINLYEKQGYRQTKVNDEDTYKISWETQNGFGEMDLFLMRKKL